VSFETRIFALVVDVVAVVVLVWLGHFRLVRLILKVIIKLLLFLLLFEPLLFWRHYAKAEPVDAPTRSVALVIVLIVTVVIMAAIHLFILRILHLFILRILHLLHLFVFFFFLFFFLLLLSTLVRCRAVFRSSVRVVWAKM
jgi:hypothetical protein